MIERRPVLDFLSHVVLVLGVLIVFFPLYVAFVASTQTAEQSALSPLSLVPGGEFINNYSAVLFKGAAGQVTAPPVLNMLWVSLATALIIAIGKISISMLSAFAIVYFRFPGRGLFFWMIFVTLML
ncbi:glycerol-3-phosphate ABC transporter permease, partial [Acinetobacter baumannii]